MAEKKSFVLYTDYQKHINKLTDEEAGTLFKALFKYAEKEELPELTPMADMAFSFISAIMDRDNEKWEEIKKKRSEAVKKRWEKEKQTDTNDTNVYKCIQTDTNDTVNVNGNVNVNVNDNVNVIKGVIGGKDKPSPRSPVKKKYGNFQHVALTDEQYKKLLSDYGQATLEKYIQAIDDWVQLKGKGYKDYNLAIRKWIAKDDVTSQPKDDFDVDKYKAFVNRF